jgi:chorismate synthase
MNTFGRLFRVSILGESHSDSVGVVIDGCPAGINLKISDFKKDINKRRSGTFGTTKRIEEDLPEIINGIYNDKTTGAPILINFRNRDIKSSDYLKFTDIPRPSHADFTANKKYSGYNDPRGSGQFSGRLTIGLVAAGVIAKKIISPTKVSAELIEAGGSKNINNAIEKAVKNQDSIGGIIECDIANVPIGLGEPFFDSVESMISHIVFSIPAIKGIEFGSGFKSAKMSGSQHNDVFINIQGKTKTNNAGGINGGITNGNNILFRVAVKPPSSIAKAQKTMNFKTKKMEDLIVPGRHDVCVALRVPVIVETAAAIALADFILINKSFK